MHRFKRYIDWLEQNLSHRPRLRGRRKRLSGWRHPAGWLQAKCVHSDFGSQAKGKLLTRIPGTGKEKFFIHASRK
jgi:hypothetical protein